MGPGFRLAFAAMRYVGEGREATTRPEQHDAYADLVRICRAAASAARSPKTQALMRPPT
jgi:hypothetical protein